MSGCEYKDRKQNHENVLSLMSNSYSDEAFRAKSGLGNECDARNEGLLVSNCENKIELPFYETECHRLHQTIRAFYKKVLESKSHF